MVLRRLGTQAGGAAGGGGHGTVLPTAAGAPAAPSTGGGLAAGGGPGLAGARAGGGPTAASLQAGVEVVLWTVDLTGQLQDHVQGLPPLVPHQADRALVHHLVQDHQVVVLQHGVRN